jgi:hypothetical protein
VVDGISFDWFTKEFKARLDEQASLQDRATKTGIIAAGKVMAKAIKAVTPVRATKGSNGSPPRTLRNAVRASRPVGARGEYSVLVGPSNKKVTRYGKARGDILGPSLYRHKIEDQYHFVATGQEAGAGPALEAHRIAWEAAWRELGR